MDDDRLPRRSYELIALLDEITEHPKWPITPAAIRGFNEDYQRLAIYMAGARNLVDILISRVEEEISVHGEDKEEVHSVGDESWGGLDTVLGPDGDVRQFLSSLRVAGSEIGRKLGARLRS